MRLAIVGTGPTGIYSFFNLIQSADPVEIVLYERGEKLGVGMPYSPGTASVAMLANIASIEIPPLTESYLDWIRRQPASKLEAYGLDATAIDDRAFTPRLLLGAFFHDQMMALIEQARAAGMTVTSYAGARVTDMAEARGKIRLTTMPATQEAEFDRVIVATGHVFEEDDDLTDHYFPNPWSGLLQVEVPAARVGIMGTSLSAIDAAMAVASQHGKFRRDGKGLQFETAAKGALMLSLMSWSGVLPEADFYCPLPYEPLDVMTEARLAEALRAEQTFDAVYGLFQRQILAADPAWAQSIGLQDLDAEGFAAAYFQDRERHDPFHWARANLAEAERNKLAQKTVAWRYAILRMHEPVEEIVPALTAAERDRFDATLKKVFVDNYAAVPAESIRRLLALRDAGVLTILALGEDYRMEHGEAETVILAKGQRHVFDIFIDARGQKPMMTKDLPFPTLRRDMLAAGQDEPQIGEDYGLLGVKGYEGRLYLAALPFLMQDQPFVQGITACAEIGAAIARAEMRQRRRRRCAA